MLADVAKNLKSAYDQVEEVFLLGPIQLDEYEKELNNIQHEIEITEFNPFTAYKVMKRFQDLRRLRRELKNDLKLAEVILNEFGGREKAEFKFQALEAKTKCVKNRQDNLIIDTGVIRNILK